MKKLLSVLALASALALVGCSAADEPAATNDAAAPEAPAAENSTPEPEPELVDLVGDWKQANPATPNNYQQATITEDTISIDWVNEEMDSKSIYWVGTYTAPTEPGDTWTWTSERDAAATDTALLASTDDTKDFTYEDGVISYDVTAMGTTTTVKLEKQ